MEGGPEASPALLHYSPEDEYERNGDAMEGKVVAKPSSVEDDYIQPVASPCHRRCVSVDLVAKVPTQSRKVRGQIDTAQPFESVKAAVSKFGGIVDWKAHRVQTVERRKFIEIELERAQEEMPSYKQQCEAAEEAKTQVLKELESTKRLIEELKLNLERAQTEEEQAKQDSELAKLRVEEMEQGIADEASFAAKAQLEVAKARHAAAVSELKTVQDELDQLRKDFALLLAEKDAAQSNAEEALSVSKQAEKALENLTIELITLKQSLDSEHSAHLEAEEHRLGAVMAKEEDKANWEMELKQAEEELERLNHQVLSTKDLKSKLAQATALLHHLKAELAAYMETGKEGTLDTRGDIEAAIDAAKKELAHANLKIEKATDQVNHLKVASTSLQSQLQKENTQLTEIQDREEKASTAIASIQMELNSVSSQLALLQMKQKEERAKMMDLPRQLEEAAHEADHAKALTQTARQELHKAKDEAQRAKAGAAAMETKLRTVLKEIEAAKASEKLALAAITALEERKDDDEDNEDSESGITLSLEEYYELSKRAHEAEEEAKMRIDAAMSEMEAAKESELKSLNKLEEVSKELSLQKSTLESAVQKAEASTQGKLNVEQELRKRKAEHEERRTRPSFEATISEPSTLHQRSPRSASVMESLTEQRVSKKKKKAFFPRIFMFLGRRKTHASSSNSSSKTD